jgi:hypothetical protein
MSYGSDTISGGLAGETPDPPPLVFSREALKRQREAAADLNDAKMLV